MPSKNPSKKHLLLKSLLRTLLRSVRLHDPLGVHPRVFPLAGTRVVRTRSVTTSPNPQLSACFPHLLTGLLLLFRDRKKGSLRKGSFAGGISRISKISRISRKWPDSPLFSTVWGFSKISRISKFSRKWIFLKRPLFQKTPFSEPDFFFAGFNRFFFSGFVHCQGWFSKRMALADAPRYQTPGRGYIRKNRPFTKPPFCFLAIFSGF